MSWLFALTVAGYAVASALLLVVAWQGHIAGNAPPVPVDRPGRRRAQPLAERELHRRRADETRQPVEHPAVDRAACPGRRWRPGSGPGARRRRDVSGFDGAGNG